MLMMQRSHGLEAHIVVLAALALNLLIMMGSLLAAGPLMKLLGYKVEAVITRLLGVLLAALAAQFVVDGIRASFT
jgi:multiple antibiotic resistance protein